MSLTIGTLRPQIYPAHTAAEIIVHYTTVRNDR